MSGDTLHDDEAELGFWLQNYDELITAEDREEFFKQLAKETTVTTEKMPDGMYRHTFTFGKPSR